MAALKKMLKRTLSRCGYDVTSIETIRHFNFRALLHRRLTQTTDFFFIEIGANDGVTNDPLYQFVTEHHDKISGIVIEPMKDIFERLCRNYRNYPRIAKVNAAVHPTAKELPLYRVDPAKAKDWPGYDRRSSFDKGHLLRNRVPEEVIVAETVKCVSADDLFEEYHVSHIDLLQIDTEGYDAEIIRSIDFDRIRPTLIHFEHNVNTSSGLSPEDLVALVRLLNRNGYQVIMEGRNAMAYQMLMDYPEIEQSLKSPCSPP